MVASLNLAKYNPPPYKILTVLQHVGVGWWRLWRRRRAPYKNPYPIAIIEMSNLNLRPQQFAALLDTRDWLTNAAQTCAFVMAQLRAVNWVGFYLQSRPGTLVLGPFQGLPACKSHCL